MDCRVVIAQTNPALGDLHKNLAEHVRVAEAAAERGADLVVFPELSLTGYFLKDQTPGVARDHGAAELDELRRLSERVSLVAGFVERSPEGRLYNASALFEDGELRGIHRKVHLVTYGMFDDARDFAPGDAFEPIVSKHGRFGVLLCEDAWHASGAWLHFLNDVDAILIPSAGPARGVEAPGPGFSSSRVWDTLLRATALMTQTYVLYANRVGFEDGIAFAGESRAYSPFGDELDELVGLDPGTLDVRIESAELTRARTQTPLRRDARPHIALRQLRRHVLGSDPESAQP